MRLSRRRSLLLLGGAVATTLTVAEPVAARKNRRQRKGADCQKRERQRCSNDAGACKASVLPLCSPLNPDGCLTIQACCEACSADGFLTCIREALRI